MNPRYLVGALLLCLLSASAQVVAMSPSEWGRYAEVNHPPVASAAEQGRGALPEVVVPIAAPVSGSEARAPLLSGQPTPSYNGHKNLSVAGPAGAESKGFWFYVKHPKEAAKKCARLAGLFALEGINCGLWGIEESGRGAAPLFYSLVTGKGANEITRTWHGAARLASLLATLGGWAFLNYYCGVDIDMVRNSSIMWAVDLFFDGYSKLRGRENDFSRRFRRWPQKAQQLFIAGVKRLMAEIETHADQAQIKDEDFDAV